MAYSYVVTSQKPTCVHHTVKCNFTSKDDLNLIVAKGNHLEVHLFKEEGLTQLLDLTIFGKITALDFYRPANDSKDVLFVLSERKHFSILAYDSVSKKVVPTATGNVKDRVGRDIETGQRGFVDPDRSMITMLLYDGLMKVVPMEANGLKEAFNLRLEMLRYLDLKYLHGCLKPTICILFEDNRRCRHVRTYVVDLRDKELLPGSWSQNNVDNLARLLIPIPSPSNGVVVVGETTILYTNGAGNIQSVAIQQTQVCTYCQIDADGSRYLLGDIRGDLFVLVLLKEGPTGTVCGLAFDYVGSVSIPETLTYLDNGVFFVGSAFGDSQLIKLLPAPNENGSYVQVLDTYLNIGPVIDMCVVESDRQGQCQLVTCSGAFKDGSVRVIRSGIGIHEQASVEIPGIKGLWSVRLSENAPFDKFLVQAFIGESRVLSIDNEEMSEAEIQGFDSNRETLFCCNVMGGMFVQVTPQGARVIDCASLQLVNEFVAPRTVTVASANAEQVVLALSGGEVVYLEVDAAGRRLVHTGSATLDQDVACISLRPLTSSSSSADPSEHMAIDGEPSKDSAILQGRSSLLVLGMWTDNSVRLLALPTLQELARVQLGTDTQARDVLIVSLEGVPYLLVGLGDGTLITYTVDFTSGLPSLTGRRKVVLGTHPISLSCFSNGGVPCVFAACDRPTVVYTRNGKLLFSVVNIQEVTDMAPFHSEMFPECLALSSEEGLMIGTVDDIQKLHVQSFPLGDNEAPRRICHNGQSGVYSVCTERTIKTDRGYETLTRVTFLDDGSMQPIFTLDLDRFEQGLSCTTVVFEPGSAEYFVVGSAYVVPDEQEPTRGRILVFEVVAAADEGSEEKRLHLLTEKEEKGAVFTLAPLCGKLVAGIGSKVQVYKLNLNKEDESSSSSTAMQTTGSHVSSGQATLQRECGNSGHILALYIKTRGDFVLVGDLLRSMSLLQYKQAENTLEEVARDYYSNYMRAIETMGDDDHFLGSDDHGNLFCMRRQADATADEDRSKMEPQGEFSLGDHVNVFRRGSLNSQPADQDVSAASGQAASSGSSSAAAAGLTANIAGSNSPSSLLFGTVNGAIGTVMTLSYESFVFFSTLERAIKTLVPAVGGFSHDDFRSFSNDRRCTPQRNMVDGDLVESLLDLDRAQMEQIVRHMNDEIAAASNTSTVGTGLSSAATTASTIHSVLSGEKSTNQLTVEEVVRRVEDMARLH